MTQPPVIGLTTYGRDERQRFSLPAAYVDAIREAGGIPVLIPLGEPNWRALVGVLDGIVLTGGGDLDPSAYGGAQHPTLYMVDAERDATELALALEGAQTGLPTLGICRGSQVLNVALGGTLVEHLPDVVGDRILHRLPPREPTSHLVSVLSGSRLAEVLGRTDSMPVSWHHQAVRQVGNGLEVAAYAEDQTIEAVEMRSHPWFIGVQWHPELSFTEDPVQRRLFQSFVAAAAAARKHVRPKMEEVATELKPQA